jgi:hypothetical protein
MKRMRQQMARPGKMEVVIIMSWCIWRCKNNWVFQDIPPTTGNYKNMFEEEMKLMRYRLKPAMADCIRLWLHQM